MNQDFASITQIAEFVFVDEEERDLTEALCKRGYQGNEEALWYNP